MCTACLVAGGGVNRTLNPNRSKDCMGCSDKTFCRKCGDQACYQRPGNSCAKTGSVEGGHLCHQHQIEEERLATKDKEPIKCPRCGTLHWLLPGETVCCHGQTDSHYASHGICYLHVGRAKDGK